jgi:hypothetical protein
LDQKAHPKCLQPFNEYEACAKRVAAGTVEAGKNCAGYYGEYWQCIDKAVSQRSAVTRCCRTRHEACIDADAVRCLCCDSRLQNAKALFSKLR